MLVAVDKDVWRGGGELSQAPSLDNSNDVVEGV